MIVAFDVLQRTITLGLQFVKVKKHTIIPLYWRGIMKTSYQGRVYHFKSFDELWRFYCEKLST